MPVSHIISPTSPVLLYKYAPLSKPLPLITRRYETHGPLLLLPGLKTLFIDSKNPNRKRDIVPNEAES